MAESDIARKVGALFAHIPAESTSREVCVLCLFGFETVLLALRHNVADPPMLVAGTMGGAPIVLFLGFMGIRSKGVKKGFGSWSRKKKIVAAGLIALPCVAMAGVALGLGSQPHSLVSDTSITMMLMLVGFTVWVMLWQIGPQFPDIKSIDAITALGGR